MHQKLKSVKFIEVKQKVVVADVEGKLLYSNNYLHTLTELRKERSMEIVYLFMLNSSVCGVVS